MVYVVYVCVGWFVFVLGVCGVIGEELCFGFCVVDRVVVGVGVGFGVWYVLGWEW